jgi:hypothetical protein
MRTNLTATLEAYEQVSPSILSNYVTEAPNDGLLYGRQNKTWIPVMYKPYIYMGADAVTIMTANELATLEFKNSLEDTQTSIVFNKTLTAPNYIWFCSTKEIGSIVDVDTGFEVDYIQQSEPVIIEINRITYTFHCYRTTNQLLDNSWKFMINFTSTGATA